MCSRMYTYRERESERVNRDLIIIALYAKQEQQRKNTYR